MQPCDNESVIVDKENNFITTPAYMNSDSNAYDIYKGIDKMIHETINRIKH